MRDILWTIIGIWVLWRIIDAFRSFSSKTKVSQNSGSNQNYNQNQSNTHNSQPKKGELKSDAGEYIDYEEIK